MSTPTKYSLLNQIEAVLLDRLDDIKREFNKTVSLNNTHIIEGVDLITSNMQLHMQENPREFILKAGKALNGDGLFLASTLGVDSFKEINKNNNLPHIKDVGNLMQNLQFALPVIDRDVITINYNNFEEMFADLNEIYAGFVSNLKELKELYNKQNEKLPLTLEIIYLAGWKPHKSQQQPLKPGSAKVSLEEFFTTE